MTDRPDRPQSIPVIVTDPPDVQHERAHAVSFTPIADWEERVFDAHGDPMRLLARAFVERVDALRETVTPAVSLLLQEGQAIAAAYLEKTKGGPGGG